MNLPYVIVEIANVHGGSRDELFRVIDEYGRIDYPHKAIKFQPFEPDQIALPDYQWFQTYQELYLQPYVWKEAIAAAAKVGDVWLDIFDTYGVEILVDNEDCIAGIKLQSSVLDNLELVTALSTADIERRRLLVNVSGHEVSSIRQYVTRFRALKAAELILQIGFQSYPTLISDTGLQKISVLRTAFPDIPLCFADHAPAEIPAALQIPAWATLAGCTYVEKHFCTNRGEAKYDYFSALEPDAFRDMLMSLRDLATASCGPFVSDPEATYLQKSYQSPIARHELMAGKLIGLSDVAFRRTGQSGLTWNEILSEQSRPSILNRNIPRNSTLSTADFKKASIGAIVACRMKSSRLKMKAVLPINGVPSVERCLHNCLLMPGVDIVVLATSTVEEDLALEQHTMGGRAKFYAGEADDVIRRYLGACSQFAIDVVVRVTADCPVVSPEITDFLLKSHFEAGADYTAPKDFAVGSSPEIYSVEALRRVIALLGKADHSEYMTWYLRNNPDVFHLNLVEIPNELRRDYRLTLDYPEDLAMFNQLYSILDERRLEATLMNVFSVLDADSSIPTLNQHLTLRYQTDAKLIDKLTRVTRIPHFPARGVEE